MNTIWICLTSRVLQLKKLLNLKKQGGFTARMPVAAVDPGRPHQVLVNFNMSKIRN
jgi:hypothetical protein